MAAAMTQNERNCDGSRLLANQTEFQMNLPRQKLAIEKRGSDKLFSAFLKFFKAPFQLGIDRSEFSDS